MSPLETIYLDQDNKQVESEDGARFVILRQVDENGKLESESFGVLPAKTETKALKVAPPSLDDDEQARLAAEKKLMNEIAIILAAEETKAANDIESRREWTSDELKKLLQETLEINLVDVAEAEFNRQAMMIGVSFDTAAINVAAAEWAKHYSYETVDGINETTKKLVSNAVQKYIETPGMNNADLRRILETGFSPKSAETIAVTEVTRAYSAGTNIYQRMLKGEGVDMIRRWNTAHDDRVCPICAPLNRVLETEWADRFPNGPAAHGRCRCWTTLTIGD